MLDALGILQDARSEALAAISLHDLQEWRFVFHLMCNAIGHICGRGPEVEITHEGVNIEGASA